ncbi:MAG: hypothetical protein KBD43_11590 [Saprospiraceae bacterium]|nr:hypothetical protein [Saprospiraceae bacterium]
MRISDYGLALLLSGEFAKLSALSDIVLFDSHSYESITALCRSSNFLDDFHYMFIDPITQENITHACVISSGMIISQSSADAILANTIAKKIKCPITQNELSKNISSTGRGYVLLPQVDMIISRFEELASAINKTSLRVTETNISSFDEGSITLLINKGRIKVLFDFFEEGSRSYQSLVDFLSLIFPDGEIKHDWAGYTMDERHFGHGWISDYRRSLCLNFWFPHSSEMKRARRMFSDYHIQQVAHLFLSILSWPSMADDLPLAREWSFSSLEEEHTLVVIDHLPISFWKMLLSIHEFLTFTHQTAKQLRFHVVNVPRESAFCIQRPGMASSYFFKTIESSSKIRISHDQPGI